MLGQGRMSVKLSQHPPPTLTLTFSLVGAYGDAPFMLAR